MKNREKQSKESGKAQIALLAAVVLAAAGAGVWSELHAATVVRNAGSLTVFGAAGFGSITDNGDGTATVQVGDTLFDDQGFIAFSLGGSDPANTSYSQTVSIKPSRPDPAPAARLWPAIFLTITLLPIRRLPFRSR